MAVMLIVTFINSFLMLVTDYYYSFSEKYPIVGGVAHILMLLCLFVLIPMQLGRIARSEISALPWEVWRTYLIIVLSEYT